MSESLQALGLSGAEWVKLALEDEKVQCGQLGGRGTREGKMGREWLLPGPCEKQETAGTVEPGGQVAGMRGPRSH